MNEKNSSETPQSSWSIIINTNVICLTISEHKMWSENEKSKSSTWKEMKAIAQALITFKEVYKYKNIKWYTDNQNCAM
jgi:hypothetical protein